MGEGDVEVMSELLDSVMMSLKCIRYRSKVTRECRKLSLDMQSSPETHDESLDAEEDTALPVKEEEGEIDADSTRDASPPKTLAPIVLKPGVPLSEGDTKSAPAETKQTDEAQGDQVTTSSVEQE